MPAHDHLRACVQVGTTPQVDKLLLVLKERVWEELKLQSALLEIQGCLEPVLAASLAGLTL